MDRVRKRLKSSNTVKPDPYKVGYRRPPKHTQFRKGQSGNPAGRPSGSRNLATVLEEMVNERVMIYENGQRKTISKLEAAVKQLVNKATLGDARAMQQLLGLMHLVDDRSATSTTPDEPFEQADQKVIQGILERMQPTKPGEYDESE